MTDTVALVTTAPLGAPAELALARLSAALQQRGWTCRRLDRQPAPADAALTIVLGSAQTGAEPESLTIRPLPPQEGRPASVHITGGDDRGLSYAILESARRVELEGPGPGAGPTALLDCFPPTTESPQRPLRSLCVFPHNATLEQEWYASLDFWRWYFDLLALHRFNRFTLTFGHQTSYLAPPYPFFVPVPEHPEVRATDFDARAREEHLSLLQGIAGLAVERGLDFCLGIWSQHAHSYGPSSVTGLDQSNMASYCAAGLRRLLEACPQVSAVQLRVNAESGIHLDEGAHFWRALFDGVAACGRRVTLDLRAKAIADDTVTAALATGLPVLVNTKFWTEHQGLPYHATLLQEGDRYVRRHSYGDQLRYSPSPGVGRPHESTSRARPYDFLFQLWNLGTNRLLLWADPQWVRRFAAASTLAGATGFEVCAPLSHKGFGNRGGAWSIFADPSLRPPRWEQERYWPWYLLFGRLGYHGDASPDVWRREWASRLGREAAPHLERALHAASGVLPLLTARHSPSASVFGYWPEKDMGGLLDLYLQVPASDVAMFASAQEAVAARLNGDPDARQTPEQSGDAFSRLATDAETALERALDSATPAGESAARELRGVALDVRVQAALARYHAAKLTAATHLAAFYAAGDLDSLLAARPPAAEALATWEHLVRLTDGVYQDDLIFGRPHDQDGHWKDNLPYARHDLRRLDEVEALWRRYGHFDLGFDFGAQLPPRTGTPPLPYLHDYPTERRFLPVGPQTLYSPHTGYGWGGTYGLLATAFPPIDGKTLRASAPHPSQLPSQALYADFVHRHPAAGYDNATFLVDLPNGDYEVTAILADRSPTPVDHGPLTLRLQGRHELGPLAVPAGEIVERRQRVRVSAGRLDVEVSAPPQGDWLLTALLVTRVAPHIGHFPPPCARPARSLPLRATVSSPEPLRTVAVHYRYGADGPFKTLPLTPVPEPDVPATGTPGPRYVVELTPPAGATLCEYYLVAEDVQGTRVTWPPAGSLGPRRLHVGAAEAPPRIAHTPPPPATPGQPLRIRARVSAGAPLARATLHYRNLNQMQTHDLLPLLPEQGTAAGTAGGLAPAGEGEGQGREVDLVATIPGEHVDPQWDLMYHLEAVDVLGNGAFFPGLEAGTPYVVLPVRRPPLPPDSPAAPDPPGHPG